jgi:type I restriction enzyme S subunit
MNYKEKISLKNAIEFIVDNRGKTVPTSDQGIALIATNCINNISLFPEFKNVRYISGETFNNWFRAHPKPDDIIFTLKGSQNGAACLVPKIVNFAIAQDMVALRANKKIMDPYFLLAVLRSKEVQYSIKSLDVSDVIPHLKKGDFDKLLLPKPSLEIQKSIGQIFITLERKIELNRQMNQTLEAIA